MQVQPYLFFDGRCEEAIEFYRKTLGAEVTMLMRFKDSPEPPEPGMGPPGAGDKVMHMSFRIGETTVLASDGRCHGQPSFQGFSLSLTVPNDAEAERLFAALGRRRAGADAVDQDLLFLAIRHGRRPLRRVLDDLRGVLKVGSLDGPGFRRWKPFGCRAPNEKREWGHVDAIHVRREVSMLIRGLIALAVIVVVFVLVVAMRPSDFRITRTATISAPPPAVFGQVNDFHKWEAWSPWTKLDPAMKTTYEGAPAGTGAIYAWVGNSQVGEGRMTIMESRPSELVRIRLEFSRPFTATNTAEFTFRPEGDQTAVLWSMTGKYNFITKAVGLFMNMDKMVGGQFEEGLARMKSVVEAAHRLQLSTSRGHSSASQRGTGRMLLLLRPRVQSSGPPSPIA